MTGVGSPEPPVGLRAVAWVWRLRGLWLMAVDALVVGGTYVGWYYLRFHLQLFAIKYVAPTGLGPYVQVAAGLAALWVYMLWRSGGYDTTFAHAPLPMVRHLIFLRAGVTAMVVAMTFSFLYRPYLLSRQVYLASWLTSCAILLLVRELFRLLDGRLARRGVVTRRVAILGRDPRALALLRQDDGPGSTVSLAGHIGLEEPGEGPPAEEGLLGTIADLDALLARGELELLVLPPTTLQLLRREAPAKLMSVVNTCEARGVECYALPLDVDISVAQSEVGAVDGLPVVRLQDAASHPLYRVVKRVVDVVLASALLVAAAPLWLFVALLVKATSRGPVFFFQDRAGLGGVPFRMIKFRSMVEDAEKRLGDLVDVDGLHQPVFKIAGDPRVTPVGRILRRTGLDEIPQLVNVLAGSMSLVGPRPEEQRLVARYDEFQRRRLKALPGITGLQQVMCRGSVDLDERIRYDLLYLKHQSLLLDLMILARTVLVVLRGSGTTH